MANNRMLSLIGIYLVIFIDNLGAGLIIPMLTPIVHDPTAGLISVGSERFRNAVYGIALGAFSLSMFFGAPLLGALSDSLGRKKTLVVCLSGLALSYFFLALALGLQSLWLFIAGRFIGGFFSGSLPVAQASIIDVADKKQRARFIGYVMFFVSSGYVVGPLIGGFLSDSTLLPWFTLKTPFQAVAGLSVFNLILFLLFFHEEKTRPKQITAPLPNPVKSLLETLKSRDIRRYSLLLLMMLTGWNTFFQFIGLFLATERYFSRQEISIFIAWVGLGLAAAFLALVGVMMKIMKPADMAVLALMLMAVCMGGSLSITHASILYLLGFIGAVGFGLSYSGLMVQLSTSVDVGRQGAIMGMAAAIAALSAGFSGFVFGFVVNISAGAPVIIALACILVALLMSFKGPKAL